MWFESSRSARILDGANQVSLTFLTFAAVGVSVFAAWAVATGSNWTTAFIAFGITGIVAGASSMLGALVGFLFGIPRTLQEGAETVAATGETRQLVNTNLERVSDWLTTMLIGATLIQITSMPELIWQMTGKIVETSTLTHFGFQGMLAGTFIYFLIVGFFSGYLLTRLYLAVAFSQVQDRLNARDKENVLASAPQPDATPTQEQIASATEIAKTPLASLRLPDEIQAWAEAQNILGNTRNAAEAFQRLVQVKPEDPQPKLSYAATLDKLRQPDKADQMRQAASSIIDRTSEEQKKRLEISTMMSLLYRPGGYDDVITIGENYVASAARPSAEVHFLMAAGYAQKYARLKRTGTETAADPDTAETRRKAIDNLRTSIAINPANKDRAKLLWDPNYPNKDKSENDFEIFNAEKDEEFAELLK